VSTTEEGVRVSTRSDKAIVELWRLEQLIAADYPQPLAERLAGSEADLHVAVDLIGQGCQPELAAQILL
jgi:hypothetical protein